jgi:hypothetical protein
MNNEIRTNLLLKVNSELNKNLNNNFKSLSQNNENSDYKVQFNEYFHCNSSENGGISKNLSHKNLNISELDTNTCSPSNIKILRAKTKNNKNPNTHFSLIFLRNLSNDLKYEEIENKRFQIKKSNTTCKNKI